MARLAGVVIADRNSIFDSGAAFFLSKLCTQSEVVQPDSNWEVEVRSGSPYIVARGKSGGELKNVSEQAYEAAQKGLDLLSINGITNLSICNAFDDCLIWWRENSIQILRIVSIGWIGNASTIESVGMVPPKPIYHESLRYFRLSQVTDDLFDAYRNMYLCLELLVSSKSPKKNRESECEWLKRVLNGEASQISPRFQPVAKSLINEIYDIRCKLFHAKENADYLVPHSWLNRQRVNKTLVELTEIVCVLARELLNVCRSRGFMTSEGFKHDNKWMTSNPEILVSDSDVPLTEQEKLRFLCRLLEEQYGNRSPLNSDDFATISLYESAVALDSRYEPELSDYFLDVVLGKTDSTQLSSLKKISRLALWSREEKFLGFTRILKAELTPESIDQLEVQIGLGLINILEPRYFFKT